jgi:CrcB protein
MSAGGRLLLVALAGAAGALTRWGLATAVGRVAPVGFPYGTLAVNVAGCILAGVVWALAEERLLIHADVRTILLVGFMGSFTTFSAYALETSVLAHDARWAAAAANVLVQNVLGVAALFVGLALGRTI